MAYIYGMIYSIDEKNRIIRIKEKKRIAAYYLTTSQFNHFGLYLQEGVIVFLNVNNEYIIRRGCKVREVKTFHKVLVRTKRRQYSYYDYDSIKEGVVKVLRKPTYRLFLDFEFSMPPYNHRHGSKDFYTEIISYGIYLLDEDNKLVDNSYGYVKPECKTGMSDRTMDFLKIRKEDLMYAPPFYKFYNLLKDYMTLYQPTIYIWGRNDYLVLDNTYKRLEIEPITNRKNFVNIMQLIKTYYNIKNDIGLYAAYELFNKKPPMVVQDHNALHDAACTVEIYKLFMNETKYIK